MVKPAAREVAAGKRRLAKDCGMSTQDTFTDGMPPEGSFDGDGPPPGMFGGDGPPPGMFGGDGPPPGMFDGDGPPDGMFSFPELAEDEYNPYDPRVLQNPFPFYQTMREKATVYKSPLSSQFWMFSEGGEERDVYIVTGYRELAVVLENSELFTSEEKAGVEVPEPVQNELARGYPIMSTLYSLDPPEHTRRRHVSQRALSGERVAAKEPEIRATANEFIDKFVRDGHADLYKQYCTPFVQAAMLDFIGMPRADHGNITGWTQAFQEVCIPGTTPVDQVQAARDVVAYQRYFEEAIASRQARPRDDLLGVLAEARNAPDCPISMGEMLWGVMELIGAGYGNTAESLVNVFHTLLVEPARWDALLADPSLAGGAVEEALRMEGSVHWLSRSTAKEVELGGVTLPAGTTVVCLFAAANRDPEAFPNPDEFDLRRAGAGPLGRHLATGRGVHYCVGGLWARAALRIGVETLLERIPDVRFKAGFQANYLMAAPMIRVVSELPVVWDPARLH